MNKNDEIALEKFKNKRIKATLSIAGTTLSLILTFFLIGYSIDTYYNTKPYGIIISLVVSYPVVQIILYRILKKIF